MDNFMNINKIVNLDKIKSERKEKRFKRDLDKAAAKIAIENCINILKIGDLEETKMLRKELLSHLKMLSKND